MTETPVKGQEHSNRVVLHKYSSIQMFSSSKGSSSAQLRQYHNSGAYNKTNEKTKFHTKQPRLLVLPVLFPGHFYEHGVVGRSVCEQTADIQVRTPHVADHLAAPQVLDLKPKMLVALVCLEHGVVGVVPHVRFAGRWIDEVGPEAGALQGIAHLHGVAYKLF